MPSAGVGWTADHGQDYALGIVSFELALSTAAAPRMPGKEHDSGRVAIDAMDDERARLAATGQVVLHVVIDRRASPRRSSGTDSTLGGLLRTTMAASS